MDFALSPELSKGIVVTVALAFTVAALTVGLG